VRRAVGRGLAMGFMGSLGVFVFPSYRQYGLIT